MVVGRGNVVEGRGVVDGGVVGPVDEVESVGAGEVVSTSCGAVAPVSRLAKSVSASRLQGGVGLVGEWRVTDH